MRQPKLNYFSVQSLSDRKREIPKTEKNDVGLFSR